MSTVATKRSNETSGALVPVQVTKKTRTELVAYAAKNRRADTRSSSLFAPIIQLVGHEGEVFCCKFSPDGNLLVSAGFDQKINLWNVYGECENWTTIAGHTGAILDLRFNQDGTEIVTCSTDKSIMIWDLNTCQRVKKYKTHKNFINCIDTSRQFDKGLICSGSDDNTVKLWDRRKKAEALNLESKAQILSIAFNETCDQIISGGIDNNIKVWDIRKNGILYEMKGHTDSVTGLSLSPDGCYVGSNSMDNTIRIWDIRPYSAKERCQKILYGHTHSFEKNLMRVAWSPDGSMISAGSADKFHYIWETDNSNIAYKLPGHLGSINDVAFHPKEPIIVSASSDKKLFLGEL